MLLFSADFRVIELPILTLSRPGKLSVLDCPCYYWITFKFYTICRHILHSSSWCMVSPAMAGNGKAAQLEISNIHKLRWFFAGLYCPPLTIMVTFETAPVIMCKQLYKLRFALELTFFTNVQKVAAREILDFFRRCLALKLLLWVFNEYRLAHFNERCLLTGLEATTVDLRLR